MAYIAVSTLTPQGNPNSFDLIISVFSSGGTQTTVEVFADDSASPAELITAIAEAARDACRANSESVDTDAPVMIFSNVVQVP